MMPLDRSKNKVLVRDMQQLLLALVGSIVILISQETLADLSITPNPDVLAGRNMFLSGGTITTQFDWSTLFVPDAHTFGQLAPQIPDVSSQSVTVPSSTVNTIVADSLNFGNWVDAPGFNGEGDAAAADLAINGVETFDILFGEGHQSVGFAIITGTGNLLSEVDSTGASFRFTAFDANDIEVGDVTFSLVAGGVDQAWLTINSDVPFRRLAVVEIDAVSIADQYFSNILTSETLVPEPTTTVVLSLGSVLLSLGRERSHRA